MKTQQPEWKLVDQLGDVNPIDHGGYFIFEDTTGVYPPEAIKLEITKEDDYTVLEWTAYRFILEPHTFIGGVLSDNPYHTDFAVWYAKKLDEIASCCDTTREALIELFCSDDSTACAHAYQMLGDYSGYHELDSYPLTFENKTELKKWLKSVNAIPLKREIFCSFSTVTEESAKNGDTAEHGWYESGFRFDAMDKPDSGESCEPDQWDTEEGLTAVDLAVRYLKDKGIIEASSSHFHRDVWYSTERCTEDYSSGETIEYNFHLEDFTEAEQREIFDRMKRR